jgi:UDP-N-acetylmuramate--alanine ligase
MKIELAKTEIIHFVGIGGIGMSGLALIMKGLGFKVQGSDISVNKNIERLKQNKIRVHIGHNKKNVRNSTILVISSAIKQSNSEIIKAKEKQLPIYKRGDMLAHVVSLLKRNIVVAGSHGKTTTTSLVSGIFSKAKLDPTIINGGVLNSFNNSAKLGKSDWCILESDESDGSFVNMSPTYSIITNIDQEHMDYYKTMNNLKQLFIKFIEKTPSFGKSFICLDDKNNKEIVKKLKVKNYYTYGTDNNSQFCIKNISQSKEFSKFNINIKLPGKKNFIINNIKIPLLGLHNIRNATAATAVAYTIGISKKIIKEALKEFKGVERRFNKIFTFKEATFFDDYAHHPTEIKELLKGVRHVYKKEDIVCVFQPHRISRLKDLKKEFSSSFKNANSVILCPVYSAGEKLKLGFNYLNFANNIIKNSKVNVFLIKNENQLARYVKQNIWKKKIVIGMGAGSVSAWMRNLPKLI